MSRPLRASPRCLIAGLALAGCTHASTTGAPPEPSPLPPTSGAASTPPLAPATASGASIADLSTEARAALCARVVGMQRAKCDPMADVESMLRDACAADQPLWSCRAISAAEYESCMGARDRAVCAAMERHAADCRVREQIRARCPLHVAKVEPKSAAEAAGLRSGDRITAVGATPLGAEDASVLVDAVARADGPLRLTVTRAGATRTVEVIPAATGTSGKRIGLGFSAPEECAGFLPKMSVIPCSAR